MRKAVFAIIALMMTSLAIAGEGSKRPVWFFGNPDSTYLEDLKNTLGLKAFCSNKYSSFDIGARDYDKTISYKANSNNAIGLGFIYSFLDVNFGYSQNRRADGKKGDSKKIDFQTQMYLPTTTWRIFINKYKGFYLNKPDRWIEDWNPDEYYTRDDIEATSIRATSNYFFNHKRYSNKILFAHQALQKKTAGSFLAGLAFCYNGVRGDSSFIPHNINDTLNFNLDVNSTDYFSLGINGGYAINVVIHQSWFISGLVATGISYARNKQGTSEGETTDNAMNLYLETEFGFGYNCKNFYAGLHRKQYNSMSPIGHEHNNLELRNGKTYIMFVYRIPVKSFSIF